MPLCELLDDIEPGSQVVAEVSAFQLTTCDHFRPVTGSVTNLALDHLDYHGSFDRYVRAWTLLNQRYDEVRAAGLWLHRKDPKRDQRFPSLFSAGRPNVGRPKKDEAAAPAGAAVPPAPPRPPRSPGTQPAALTAGRHPLSPPCPPA